MNTITKTILIWDQMGQEDLQFYVIDGDKTALADVYINRCEPEGISPEDWEAKQDELETIFYNEDGNQFIKPEECFPAHLGGEIQAGTCAVVVCGIVP